MEGGQKVHTSDPKRPFHTVFSRFSQERSKRTMGLYRWQFRLLARFLGRPKAEWPKVLSRFFRRPRNDALLTFERFREWLGQKYGTAHSTRYASALPALARFLRAQGAIPWEIPHPQLEESKRLWESGSPDLRAKIRRYLGHQAKNGLKPKGSRDMKHALADLGNYLGRQGLSYLKIDRKAAQSWIAGLHLKGLASRTIYFRVRTLRRFYRWLAKTGVVKEDPTFALRWRVDPPPLRRHLEEREIRALLSRTTDPCERAVVHVLYATACWSSELVGLDLRDVAARRLRLTFRNREGTASVLPITPSAGKSLKNYLAWRRRTLGSLGKSEEAALFVTHEAQRMSARQIYHVVRRSGRATGISSLSPRHLRHSFAAHFLDRGGDVRTLQELLGHRSATSTAMYAALARATLREVYDRTHPRA